MGERKTPWWERALLVGRIVGGVNGAIIALKAVGWWTVIWPLILAALTVAGGIVESVPYTMIGAATVSVFAATMALATLFRIHRENQRHVALTEPPWEFWDGVDRYMIFQAGALWAGHAPGGDPDTATPRIYAANVMIKQAVAMKRIKSADGIRHAVNLKTFVDRSELRKLAEMRGEKPRFLYPPEGPIPPA